MPNATQPSRRALLRGVSWTAPTAAVAIATPALAASQVKAGAEYGLFVTTGMNGGTVGYNGTDNTGTIHPTSPTAYFSAVKAGNNPDSDINWNDASQCYTNSGLFRNGEGSFTPVTNSASGANGAYATSSGFWWSVPTTSAYTGTGYVAGSTATLQPGATFITEVEVIIPAGPNAMWTAQNIRIAGQLWNKALSSTRTTVNRTTATHLAFQTLAGSWSITAPTITTLADGSVRVTGTITYKTTATQTASKVIQSGTIYYGQTEIMPATIQVSPSYGWTSFSLTSYVQSATISYTGQPAGMASSTTLTNQLITTSTVYNKAC
ncbi:amino acid oxidase [Brachybacterium sp. EF45031]|uniref:amino acid oxidase n=1 Tax=Brachybacterium sillae TaxID=2810536 RepID=UPI00217DC7FE|nr:amino acid oxidase [Brachybacterium sillae]MCS6712081.1 amino acid oxidase [Brachybacterium sillae]